VSKIKAHRISNEIIESWPDKQISKLVLEYYSLWDPSPKTHSDNTGGLQQSLEEVTKLKNIIGERKFKNFFEIGTSDGGSLWLYSLLFCNEDSKIVGLDIILELGAKTIVEELKKRNRNVKYVISDCNDKEKVLCYVKDESIDLLHIDANHGYYDVKEYFENYYPKVSKGGLILIHDTNACTTPDGGSVRFRKEILEPNYDHQLITGEWLITGNYDQGANIIPPGISLIRKH
tara:strand:- start:13795 stop:14490 length:696 start_codon:yes stop_codon:yes gene_type:complete